MKNMLSFKDIFSILLLVGLIFPKKYLRTMTVNLRSFLKCLLVDGEIISGYLQWYLGKLANKKIT